MERLPPSKSASAKNAILPVVVVVDAYSVKIIKSEKTKS
jgi:hypothetical protein